MKKIIPILLATTMLGACSNVELDEILATGATAGTALVTTAAGLPPVVTLTTSTGAGIVTSAITSPSNNDVDLSEVPEEERAEVLKNRDFWMAVEKLGWWAGLIFLVVWFIPSPQEITNKIVGMFKGKRRRR